MPDPSPLYEAPLSQMRQCNRTSFWELGRKASYTWQQVIAQVSIWPWDPSKGPVTAAQWQAAQDEAIGEVMAVNFDNPPVPWFNENNNKIESFGGVLSHPGPFPPVPYLQTIFGQDDPRRPTNGFEWFPTSNGPDEADGNVDMLLFGNQVYATQTSNTSYGPVALTWPRSDSGSVVATVIATRLRLLATPSDAPFPLCVSVMSYWADQTPHLGTCRQEPGNIFNPQAVPYADPMPLDFSWSTEVRVWAPSPIFQGCKDCKCPLV